MEAEEGILRSQSASALERPVGGNAGDDPKPLISKPGKMATLGDKNKKKKLVPSFKHAKRKPGPKKLAPLMQAEENHFDEPPDCDPPETLLRYDAPLFVGVDAEDCGELPGVHQRTCSPDLEDMMNAMLPPREWTQMTGTWMQYVSKQPATRDDLIALSNDLDDLLRDRQARGVGICPVRKALFEQTFDELIRQITLDQPLLGLLLLRIRDQNRMVMDATLCIHDSAIEFGLEKLIEAEPGMEELIVRIRELEDGNNEIVDHIMELYKKTDVLEKRATELRNIQDKNNRDEIEALKFQGQHLDGLLRMFGPGGASKG